MVPYNAHNVFVKMFVELGLFGGLLFIAFCIRHVFGVIKLGLKQKHIKLAMFCFLIYLNFFIDSFTQNPLLHRYIWIELALISVILRQISINDGLSIYRYDELK